MSIAASHARFTGNVVGFPQSCAGTKFRDSPQEFAAPDDAIGGELLSVKTIFGSRSGKYGGFRRSSFVCSCLHCVVGIRLNIFASLFPLDL
jgi:hypothetical protein